MAKMLINKKVIKTQIQLIIWEVNLWAKVEKNPRIKTLLEIKFNILSYYLLAAESVYAVLDSQDRDL
jgi:hypothetical protein